MSLKARFEDREFIADTYALARGQQASKRLDLQHSLYEHASQKHLANAGLTQGQTVCDVGCGTGTILAHLSQTVGPTGHVYALDASQAQLILAQKKASRLLLRNITFIQEDITLPCHLERESLDLVYARFLLMHIQTPEKAIHVMKSLLKPGGVCVSQESILEEVHASSPYPAIRQYGETLMALAAFLGVDYNIGRRLERLFEEAGFSRIKIAYHQQPLEDLTLAKQLLLMGLAEWGPKAIRAGVIKGYELEKLRKNILDLPEEQEGASLAIRQAHLIAWK